MCAGTHGCWRTTLGRHLRCSPPCLGRQCLTETRAYSCGCWPRRAPQMLLASPPQCCHHRPHLLPAFSLGAKRGVQSSGSEAGSGSCVHTDRCTCMHKHTSVSKHDRLPCHSSCSCPSGTLSVPEKPTPFPSCLPLFPSPATQTRASVLDLPAVGVWSIVLLCGRPWL